MFAGALIGVVVTILGTVWIEEYRAAAQDREHRKMVSDCITEIQRAVLAVAAPLQTGEISELYEIKQRAEITCKEHALMQGHELAKRSLKIV